MAEMTLTATRLSEGVWQGLLTGAEGDGSGPPQIAVTHLGTLLDGVELREGPQPGQWLLRVAIPPESISDGVQTYLIRDVRGDRVLGSFTLLAGDALSHDIRAEITLLRDELDMLKRAFRRHCLETSEGAGGRG